jgi:alkanesulfonate monooxygenase SsuD/methylene tetrahydromethanopterin reductase-like flavin-dependent oxidoreductase (luciferase family)
MRVAFNLALPSGIFLQHAESTAASGHGNRYVEPSRRIPLTLLQRPAYGRVVADDRHIGLLLTALPASLAIDFAQRADSANFRTAWFPEITFADSFGPATAAALKTEKIGIATGVVGIWSRSAVTMSLQAATLQQLSRGRLLLGLGVQARGYVEAWHGQRYEKPIAAMRDFVTILRRAFAGEMVTHEGDVFSVRNFHLDMELPTPPRITIAANGPKMIELAGEIADGIIGWFQSLEYVRDVTVPALHRGAERAGRSLDGFEATVGFPAVVTEDDSGIELAKGQAMMYATALGSAPAYLESARIAGFGDVAESIGERVRAGDLRGAVSLVPDEMSASLLMAGSADRVRTRIDAYREAGLTAVHVLPSPPGGYYPLYEDHFPVESLSQLPEFDFNGLVKSFEDAIRLLG